MEISKIRRINQNFPDFSICAIFEFFSPITDKMKEQNVDMSNDKNNKIHYDKRRLITIQSHSQNRFFEAFFLLIMDSRYMD